MDRETADAAAIGEIAEEIANAYAKYRRGQGPQPTMATEARIAWEIARPGYDYTQEDLDWVICAGLGARAYGQSITYRAMAMYRAIAGKAADAR